MLAIQTVVKRYRNVVIHPTSDLAARKEKLWSAIQNFPPAVGLLKLCTLFSIAFASVGFGAEKKATNYLGLIHFACAVIVWRKILHVHC